MAKTVINRNTNDLHPADRLNREWLRNWMNAEKQRQDITDRVISARVNHHSSWAHNILHTTMWRAAIAQKMVRALGWRLTFNIDSGGIDPLPLEGPTFADIYQGSSNPDRREEADRMDLCILGSRLRGAMKITPAALGHALGCEGKTVTAFESGDQPYYLMVSAQRYFRGLGCELRFVITDPEGERLSYVSPSHTETPGLVNIVELADRTMVWNTSKPETVVSFPASAWKKWIEDGRNDR